MNFLESSEDYLETILKLSETQEIVRAIDIANDMEFSKASVSIAMKKLKERGLITIEGNNIMLTEDGKAIASKIYERHIIFSKIFMALGVDEKTAKEDACRVEHDISDETFQAIKKYYLNVDVNKF